MAPSPFEEAVIERLQAAADAQADDPNPPAISVALVLRFFVAFLAQRDRIDALEARVEALEAKA